MYSGTLASSRTSGRSNYPANFLMNGGGEESFCVIVAALDS